MKTAALVLCFASLPVLALDVDGNKLTLSPAEMVMCRGGCTLVTNRSLAEMRHAVEVLLAELERQANTCKRGDLT